MRKNKREEATKVQTSTTPSGPPTMQQARGIRPPTEPQVPSNEQQEAIPATPSLAGPVVEQQVPTTDQHQRNSTQAIPTVNLLSSSSGIHAMDQHQQHPSPAISATNPQLTPVVGTRKALKRKVRTPPPTIMQMSLEELKVDCLYDLEARQSVDEIAPVMNRIEKHFRIGVPSHRRIDSMVPLHRKFSIQNFHSYCWKKYDDNPRKIFSMITNYGSETLDVLPPMDEVVKMFPRANSGSLAPNAVLILLCQAFDRPTGEYCYVVLGTVASHELDLWHALKP